MSETRWETLAESLAAHLNGMRVTHALFTTYALDLEFFETVVMAQLLPDRGQSLSMNSALRRLQMEHILREQPIHTDVYFDAGVAVPGAPWLPYNLHPMTGSEEFHGKVVLLRLEDERRSVRWLLGAGSANLSKAGWLQNIETWHFAPPFSLDAVPAGLAPGLQTLLDFLRRRAAALAGGRGRDSATQFMWREFSGATVSRRKGKARFGVFVPGGTRVAAWIGEHAGRVRARHAEVISPYFADEQHAALVQAVRDCSGADTLRVWLPHDPWAARPATLLLDESQYDALGQLVEWCELDETGLRGARDPARPRRFLHAKVLRVPGAFCFIGSVNFSNKAYFHNFEAGFLFADDGRDWLQQTRLEGGLFLEPEADGQRCDQAPLAGIGAAFDWQRCELIVHFAKPVRDQYAGTTIGIIDGSGMAVARKRVPDDGPVTLACARHHSILDALQRCTWLTLVVGGASHTVWVQQSALEHRPLPVDLAPDAWRILDLWRGLARGQGTAPAPPLPPGVPALGTLDGEDGEDEGEAALRPDLFASMAAVHGSFYALKQILAEASAAGKPGRRQYYFDADRPDTLRFLLERLTPPRGEGLPDPVETWAMLRWIEHLCLEHRDLAEARKLLKCARDELARLESRAPFDALDRRWLEWTGSMFVCAPGAEKALNKRFIA